jgi:hypothetical protein
MARVQPSEPILAARLFVSQRSAGAAGLHFRCLGDHSILQRSKAGVDFARGELRVFSHSGFEDVARLTTEEPAMDFWLRPDNVAEPVRFRFRHQP